MAKVLGEFKSTTKLPNLRAPKSGKGYYKDAGQPGLYLSVSHTGRKAWECQLKVNGKPRWKTVGLYHEDGMSLADAREAAQGARERAIAGLDPWPQQDERLFQHAWARFMGSHFNNKGERAAELYITLERRIGDSWNGRRVDSIGRTEVWDLLDRIGDNDDYIKQHLPK